MKTTLFSIFITLCLYASCSAQSNSPIQQFDRTLSKNRLEEKINKGEALVVHILVPLCDNVHQGISPVSETLGDGFTPRTNLYWGALYGIKTHFKKRSDWKLVQAQNGDREEVLERVVFLKEFNSKTKVYLVADAYKGDEMKLCVNDFIDASRGSKKQKLSLDSDKLGLFGNADLIIFNGHNGLMDYSISPRKSIDNIQREAAVIGCISYEYFKGHLSQAKTYPLITTTNLMAPEAYVVEGLINSWAKLEEGPAIRSTVGAAYNKYQKCGLRGATALFKTGW